MGDGGDTAHKAVGAAPGTRRGGGGRRQRQPGQWVSSPGDQGKSAGCRQGDTASGPRDRPRCRHSRGRLVELRVQSRSWPRFITAKGYEVPSAQGKHVSNTRGRAGSSLHESHRTRSVLAARCHGACEGSPREARQGLGVQGHGLPGASQSPAPSKESGGSAVTTWFAQSLDTGRPSHR